MGLKSETQQKYLKLIEEYCNNKNAFDFVKYATMNSGFFMGGIDEWVAFSKEYCDAKTNEIFFAKAMPFCNEDGSVNEELINYVSKLCCDIFQKKAGLIEVIDEVTPNIHQFLYMAKQLRFYYKKISPHVYNEMVKFYDRTCAYNSKKTVFNTSVASLSDSEKKVLLDFIEQHGLMLNNITYEETYYYLRNRGLLGNKRIPR